MINKIDLWEDKKVYSIKKGNFETSIKISKSTEREWK